MGTQELIDVAILGGGLAGNLLARQLRRAHPSLSISIFERETERSYKVGESTVELASNYLVRRLGLSTYLYKEHLPKNTLRFFFDTEARDAPLPSLSELGTNRFSYWPSFQLDRARLERDLLRMNAEAGVEVEIGATVRGLVLRQDGEAHTFTVEKGGEKRELRARWVVDATGRASTIAKLRDLRLPEKGHRIASAWGRFRGVGDIDDIDAPEWHARAAWTSRMLSTIHFCYPGYWIWFIPLREGLTSLGAVCQTPLWDTGRRSEEGFLSFLREHAAVASLLEGAEAIDMGHFAQLAYRTKRFFSAERWGLVGDAAAFTDPFYSPGSDFISLENDLVSDLIARDLKGEAIEERTELYDQLMHFRFENTLLIYRDLYPLLGSHDLFKVKCFFDCANYFNLWVDSYIRDEHLDLRKVRTQLRRKEGTLQAMRRFGGLFAAATAELKQRGRYFEGNLGQAHLDGRLVYGAMAEMGHDRKKHEINDRTEEIFNQSRDALMRLAGQPERAGRHSLMELAEDPSLFSLTPEGAERAV